MHDPRTVAFDIPNPFVTRPLHPSGRYHPALVTIWHVDPEKDGSDDSCDWWGRHRPLNKRERDLRNAIYDLEPILNNPPFYPDHPAHKRFGMLTEAVAAWRMRPRWRLHPKWHIWHWEVQIHPLENFKRWMFTRCQGCGKRFRWGYAPVSTAWNGTGPRWFRSEEDVYHDNCLPSPLTKGVGRDQ